MKNLKEKIAYLHGLTQGLDIEDASKEGRVLNGIIDVLEDLADQIEDIEIAHEDLEEYVETIDEDLYDLEGDVFGEDDIDMEDMIEVECPKCREAVCFESEIMDDEDLIEVTCPNCDEVVYVNDEDFLSTITENSQITDRDEDL